MGSRNVDANRDLSVGGVCAGDVVNDGGSNVGRRVDARGWVDASGSWAADAKVNGACSICDSDAELCIAHRGAEG